MTYLGPIIDPHMHLWDLDRHYYGWLQDTPLPNNPAGDMSPIAYRSYGLDDYLADTAGWNLVQTVHVECGLPPKDQLSETDWLQGLADTRGVIGGIVAGANLDDPGVEPLLEVQAARANVRGVRQIVNWHKDPAKTYGPTDLLLSDAWRAGYALLARYGLSFDLQLYPSQMATAAGLAAAHPDIPVIVNHAGMVPHQLRPRPAQGPGHHLGPDHRRSEHAALAGPLPGADLRQWLEHGPVHRPCRPAADLRPAQRDHRSARQEYHRPGGDQRRRARRRPGDRQARHPAHRTRRHSRRPRSRARVQTLTGRSPVRACKTSKETIVPNLAHGLEAKDIKAKIALLISNLVDIQDETGEFLLRLDDGRVIDTKGWNDWEWTHGIGLFGMFRFYEQTGDQRALNIMVRG